MNTATSLNPRACYFLKNRMITNSFRNCLEFSGGDILSNHDETKNNGKNFIIYKPNVSLDSIYRGGYGMRIRNRNFFCNTYLH